MSRLTRAIAADLVHHFTKSVNNRLDAIYMAEILISKRDFFLQVFPSMLCFIICIVLFVRLIYIFRKFARELKQRYPEVVEERKKYHGLLILSPLPTYAIPDENNMLDEELIALKRKALTSFIGIFIGMLSGLIITAWLHLILG